MKATLFGSKFTLANMNGRPVFIRSIGVIDGHPDKVICEESCGGKAAFIVYELDNSSWYWCGKCMAGG